MTDLIHHIKMSTINAWKDLSKLNPVVLAIEGMSNIKVRALLNNICSMADTRYLEIGTYHGSTFVSALYKNNFEHACAIDNWSEFNGNIEKFKKNIFMYLLLNDDNFIYLNKNCFHTVNEDFQNRKYNIYLYDGGHTQEDQYKALTHYAYNLDILENTFIYLCDDWSWPQVPEGTNDAINDLKLKILYKNELPGTHPNGPFWNGMGVFILQK